MSGSQNIQKASACLIQKEKEEREERQGEVATGGLE
jgi:hypothetical protein